MYSFSAVLFFSINFLFCVYRYTSVFMHLLSIIQVVLENGMFHRYTAFHMAEMNYKFQVSKRIFLYKGEYS